MAAHRESGTGEQQLVREMRAQPSTSARIRALNARGMKKKEIVNFLNAHFQEPGRPHEFRYQHVYNVLAQSSGGKRKERSERDTEQRMAELPDRLDVQLDSAGRVVVPAVYRNAMQVKEGDRLIARVVDGELRLITPRMAIRKAQKMVRESIPGDDSLADSLIADRRREFEQEYGNDAGHS
jgi:bifunctional DNA-binding transcriptional regulator/antitoxin component of YhaV-PrlF toxin-antitoxin module